MKRILSIILCLALLLPCTSVWAADSIGYLEGGNATIMVREYFQDFETPTPLSYGGARTTGKDTTAIADSTGDIKVYWTNQRSDINDPWRAFTYGNADAALEAPGSNKYLAVKQEALLKTQSNLTNPIVGPWLTFKNMEDGEKAHISFYLKNDDFIYDKEIFYAKNNRTDPAMNLIRMGRDGKMTLGYGTSLAVALDYSLNRWYKFDFVFTHNESSNDTAEIYLDGKCMLTNEYSDLMLFGTRPTSGIVYKVVSSDVSYSGTLDSVLCVDDIYAKMYSASDSIPTITPNKYAYTNFEIYSAADGSDGFAGAGENDITDYALASGVFGKESADVSAVITTDTAVSMATPSQAEQSVNVYEFDIANIKDDETLVPGAQLKYSLSYAHNSTGGGRDSFLIGGEELFSVDHSGTLSAPNASGTVSLEAEKWYNLDVILTAASDSSLDYSIRVNGVEDDTVVGNINSDSLKNSDGAYIDSLAILSVMQDGEMSESYLDDMYIEYFDGASSCAVHNSPIVNSEADLSINGRVITPVSYDIEDLLADTEGNIKILRNNAPVTSGSAEDAVVVTAGMLPVYGYVYAKLKLNTPVVTFSGNLASVTTDIISNQAEPVDITLFANVYKNGKVYSVNSDTKTCNTGTTGFSISNIDVPSDASLKIFTVLGWAEKIPVFEEKIYKADANTPITQIPFDLTEVPGDLTAFKVDSYDYTTDSLTISGTIGNGGVKNAAVYILPRSGDINTLSDTNLPVFADVINTDANGKFKLNIEFLITGTAFTQDFYNVYVYGKDIEEPLTGAFVSGREKEILEAITTSQTWFGLKATILGEDLDGNIINDNFTFINPDITNYNLLTDKDEFFKALFTAKTNILNYSDIAAQFASVALQRYNIENTPVQNPGTNFGGGSSGSVGGGTYSPNTPSTPNMSLDPVGGGNAGNSGNTGNSGNEGNSSDNPGYSGGTSSSGFSDMSGHWADPYVNALVNKGVINGYSDGSYAPEKYVTRAELVKIISTAFGIGGGIGAGFLDVSSDAWYAPHVYGAYSAGIVTGFDGNFRPDESVNRQDAAVMIYRAMSLTHELGMGYIFFADETDIASYAAENVSALAEIGIVTGGGDNRFMPLGNLTRAEAAALISRAADYILAH